MSFNNLPNELLLRIAWYVLKCPICRCQQASHHLSALARSTRRLHSVLTPDLLRSASPLQMLLWAIAHARQDTLTTAIMHGADPNLALRETHYTPMETTHANLGTPLLRETHCIPRSTSHVNLGTPLDIAFLLRLRSVNTADHQLHLETCTVLLRAGGIPSTKSLTDIAESGDQELLRCCLPYVSADARAQLEADPLPVLLDPTGEPVARLPIYNMVEVRLHYHGWELPAHESWDKWGPWCRRPQYCHGYMSAVCPMEVGGYCKVEAVSG